MTGSVPLGQVAAVLQGGIAAKTADGTDGLPFFGVDDISGGHSPRMLRRGADLSDAVRLQAVDIVIALHGDLGRSAVIDDQADGAVLGRECAALRVTAPARLLASWLYAWTLSQDFKDQAIRQASRATTTRLSSRAVAEFTLPLPPLPYQQKLAAAVDRLETALSATTQMIRDLEGLRAAEVNLAIARIRVD